MCYSTSLQDGVRVLVVDSHPDSCELLVLLLDQCGIETTVATSVSQAIELIHQAPPDLLISEILLPGEDGYSLMHRVKTLETKLHVQIPAIALTTQSVGECDRAYTPTTAFCKRLLKPLDIDELLEAVASLTGQTQAIAANACS